MSQYRIEAASGQYLGDRAEQQDRAAIFDSPHAPGYMMAVVADGMGGVTGGALAADQVIRTARHNFERFLPGEDIRELLHTIAQEAHIIIHLSAISTEKQPHSTVVILLLTPENTAWWAHAGDSRLYYFRGADCLSRTVDHSLAEKLAASGTVTREEAFNNRHAGLLVNVLGTTSSRFFVTIHCQSDYQPGDSFLLCTDGLWAYFHDRELGAAISRFSPRQAAQMLVAEAKRRSNGTKADNCTFVIVRVTEQSRPEAPAVASVPDQLAAPATGQSATVQPGAQKDVGRDEKNADKRPTPILGTKNIMKFLSSRLGRRF